jgi:Zn-dependent protease
LFSNPVLFFAVIIAVGFSVCVHEFFHAYVALKCGDSTAADAGHLTLNPLKQMGVFSLVLLALFGLAWGQVPVNPSNLKGKHAYSIVSVSGPLTNLFLSQFFMLLCFTVAALHIDNRFALVMLCYGAALNLMLFILNMMPIPGLDGWGILVDFYPQLLLKSSEAVKGTYFVVIALFFVFFGRIFSLCHGIVLFELELLARLFRI